MGSELSKFCRSTFEVINEIFTGISAGVLGLTVLITSDWSTRKIVPTLLLGTVTIGSLCYVYYDYRTIETFNDKTIVITGCDTGLGYSLAHYSNAIGFKVIAGCLDVNGKGADHLRAKGIDVCKLDITNESDIRRFISYVDESILDSKLRK